MSKRLDSFLLAEKLTENISRFRSWILRSSIYDHKPICLQLDGVPYVPRYPFKFNHSWVRDEYFCQLVRSSWRDIYIPRNANAMDRFGYKVKGLKILVSKWVKLKRMQDDQELREIEDILDQTYGNNMLSSFSKEEKIIISDLEGKKATILKKEEED